MSLDATPIDFGLTWIRWEEVERLEIVYGGQTVRPSACGNSLLASEGITSATAATAMKIGTS